MAENKNEKDTGIDRSRRLEQNNQTDKGAKSGHAARKLGPLVTNVRHNPTRGGGINRSLKSGAAN